MKDSSSGVAGAGVAWYEEIVEHPFFKVLLICVVFGTVLSWIDKYA